MADIKVKNTAKKDIKIINKSVIQAERFKDNIVHTKEKAEETVSNDTNIYEYGSNKIKYVSNRTADETVYQFNKQGEKSFIRTKDNLKKSKIKIKAFKNKLQTKRNAKKSIKATKQTFKTSKDVAKNTKKVAQQTVKNSQRAMKLAKETARKTAQGVKVAVKATISTVKAIIAGTKALIAALLAGGWVAVIAIIIICLVGLLCSSVFGIFFSGEKTSSNSLTMQDAIVECNEEFSNKLQTIQDQNIHEEYVLNGSMASWKDILLVYAVKQSNGINGQEVITMDNTKKQIVKDIFWDMNTITYEVKTEMVKEQGVNINELPKEIQKKVLHITITSKSAEDMKSIYNFNMAQRKQFDELSSDKYASLWNGIIYGLEDNGEYTTWRQHGQVWSSIRIGNTTSTIGEIGCLVTSIAILIEKSGVNDTIKPFNPGTFVESLNKYNGFDSGGNLQYAAVNKAVPRFKYIGNVNLRGKTKAEKLLLITQYFNNGYYITAEVKGATPGNQHWVAITGVNKNNVMMVDPASNQTDLWNAYKYANTSQFNYFKAN